MIENRREHKRNPLAGSANLILQGDVSIDAKIYNISLSGIGVYADEQIEEGTEVSVKINFMASSDLIETDRIKGNIVYSGALENIFIAGIAFTEEIHPEKHKELYKHIRQSLKWY